MVKGAIPFFSIIMPAYNAEKYIVPAINSLLQQSYEEWELIAVDDGSSDSTGRILDSFSRSDSRIKVIHQPNSGSAGAARNTALAHITGMYMQMLDSDDLLSFDLLEKAKKRIEETDADIVLPILIKFIDCKEQEVYRWEGIAGDLSQVISGKDAFILSLDWRIHGVVAVRSDILRSVKYNTTSMNGDEFTTRKLFYASKKVSFSDGIYFYREHNESTTKHATSNIRVFETIGTDLDIYDFIKKNKMEKKTVQLFSTKIINTFIAHHLDFIKKRRCWSKSDIYKVQGLLKSSFIRIRLRDIVRSQSIYAVIFLLSFGSYNVFSIYVGVAYRIKYCINTKNCII